MFYQAEGTSHCKIYSARPEVCRATPINPRDTAKLPCCGFQFLDEKGNVVDAYMMLSTGAHLNRAVQRRKELLRCKQ